MTASAHATSRLVDVARTGGVIWLTAASLGLAAAPAAAITGPATMSPVRPWSVTTTADVDAQNEDDSVTVTGTEAGNDSSSSGSTSDNYSYKRVPREICGSIDGPASGRVCVDGIEDGTVVRICEDGTTALEPLYRRPLDPTTGTPLGDWEQVDDGGCPEDPPVTVTLTAQDFARLPLTPSAPQLQPATGRALINVDLILYTDATPQALTTTVLGTPVAVRATPTTFTWDLGDGSAPLVTTDPGHPYPDQTVARPYTSTGTYAVTLTTTWTGTYQVNGAGPWLPVQGTATTTSAPVPIAVEQAVPHLVDNP